MIDWKQEMLREARDRKAGRFRQWKIRNDWIKPLATYRAESIADLMKERKRMQFGQTVVLPKANAYPLGVDEINPSVSEILLTDDSLNGRLNVGVLTCNYNFPMSETLAKSLGKISPGELIHTPLLACGSREVYTPLNVAHPIYLISFVMSTDERRCRGREFELSPVQRFGDMNLEEL